MPNSLQDKFRYCPAGIKLRAYAGIGVYTKFHKFRRSSGFRVREQSKHHIWVDTPDRELFITDQTMMDAPHYPEGFHTFTNLSYLHDGPSRDLDQQMVMVNYTDHMNKYDGATLRNQATLDGSIILADSGGFQLASGDYDFIDPEYEIDWLNRNVDLAMVLDIPNSAPHLMVRSAQIQKKNTDYWLAHRRHDLELVNIMHGVEEDALRYHEIVFDPAIDRLAMGGLFYLGIFPSMYNVMSGILHTNDHYKHHHVLGVTHRGAMMALMYAAKLGVSPLISVDSSSALQLSCYRTLYLYDRMEDSLRTEDIGNKGNYSTGHPRLPCSCSVCSTLVYADVFRELRGDIVDALVCMHNIHSFNHWVKHNLYLIENEPKESIKAAITSQFQSGYGPQGVKDMHALLDFVEMSAEKGVAKAKARFDRYFHSTKNIIPAKMISDQDLVKGEGCLASETAPKNDHEWTEHILNQYEIFHASEG